MYSYGVVREGDILARWTFDMKMKTDVAGGTDLLLSGAKWG